MAGRYQHVADPIRHEVARQVDGLIWQARGRAAGTKSTAPVDGQSLAILRLVELGLSHGDEDEMSTAREAIDASGPPSAQKLANLLRIALQRQKERNEPPSRQALD